MLIKLLLTFIFCLCPLVSGAKLTLSDAENKAVSGSYEMRAAYFNEQAREWEKRNALSSYLPSVSYSAGYNRLDESTIERSPMMLFSPPGTDISTMQNSVSHSFTLTQPISNGGAELIAIKIARETKLAIELEMRELEQNVIYNTRKAYFDCIIAAEQETAAREDLSWTQQNLSKAKIRQQGGGIPLTDVLQWESECANKENILAYSVASRQTMLLSLFNTFGIVTDKADTSAELQLYEAFEEWYARGFAEMTPQIEGNLQLQALNHYTIVSGESKKIAMSQLLPKLNAFVTASWPYEYQLVPEQRAGWSAGLSFDMTIFSGFRNSTNLQKVGYDYQKAIVDQQKIKNQLKLNLERICMFYKAAYHGVSAAKIQRDLMDKQLQLMQQRYDGGLVNQSQLLEVAFGSRMARVGYIQKLLECLLLQSEYLKNTGKLEVAP